jgi:ribonucleoside-diphosphate reductase beta chain
MSLSDSNLFKQSLVYKPFNYSWAVDLTVEHERMHWIESEVPLGDDVSQWKGGKITAGEKEFITQILKMFTTQDVAVGSFYFDLLVPVIRNNEVRNLLGSFAVREGTHQRAYALLNDTLGLPESAYASFLDYVELKEKADFATDARTDTLENTALALSRGVINEGLSLFASFVMLLNFQRFGKMMGMCKIVEWSIKDETKHVEGVTKLFRTLCAEHPHIVTDDLKKRIYDDFREAVRLEDAFIDLSYGQHEIEGLKAEDVKAYIRYIADRRLVGLGMKENWGIAANPLPWLDWIISAADHTNFFEAKVAEYEAGGLTGGWGYSTDQRSFTVYTKDGCPWCVRAKELLAGLGHEVQIVDLSADDARQEFYRVHGFTGAAGVQGATMPKIWETTSGWEEYVGGFTELSTRLSA